MPNDSSPTATREPADPSLIPAVERLRDDGLVAFPTETVWGLAACGESARAVDRLQRWKGRDAGQPIALLVSGPEALAAYLIERSPLAERLMRALWPGPLTLVLPCAHAFAPGIAGEAGAVGIRCSSHPLAAALAQAAERAGLGLLTATSLNRSGEPPAKDYDEARALCGRGPDAPLLLDARDRDAHGAAPTTVLDLTGPEPVVLRWGGIGAERLAALGVAYRVAGGAGTNGRADRHGPYPERENGEQSG